MATGARGALPRSLALPASVVGPKGPTTSTSLVSSLHAQNNSTPLRAPKEARRATIDSSHVKDARSSSHGPAVNAFTIGRGPAGIFRVDNPSSFAFALAGINNGGGAAVFGDANGTGQAPPGQTRDCIPHSWRDL